LKSTIDSHVEYLFLQKKRTIDVKAIKTLIDFIKVNRIAIIHAHSSSYFLACIVKLLHPKIKIVWHDHYGDSEDLKNRKFKTIQLGSFFFSAIIAVNLILKEWSVKKMYCKKVYYLPNFVNFFKNETPNSTTILNGTSGKRIVCVANLRAQKDHLNVLKAFKIILNKHKDWTLHLVGKNFNDDYSKTVFNFIETQKLKNKVFYYGTCLDIDNILQQSTIGVLSSLSEGLPVSLLEYGKNKLPVVVTNVGECAKVVTHQKNGLVVKKQSKLNLANAIVNLIENPDLATIFAKRFTTHIKENYSDVSATKQILKLYKSL